MMLKPSTPQEWAAYRAQLNCDLAIHALDGSRPPPDGYNVEYYALFCIAQAIKNIAAIHFDPNQKP